MAVLRKVPWFIWAGFATIGLARLWGFLTSGVPVEVAGSGIVSQLDDDIGPDDARLAFNAARTRSLAKAEESVHVAINARPAVVVFGLDAEAVLSDPERASATYLRLTERAEAARAVPLVVGPVSDASMTGEERAAVEEVASRWRRELCRVRGLRLCLDVAPYRDDPAGLRQAITSGIADAMLRHAEWRASTQGGA
ncbi:MAG: hypothetical protein AAGF12_38045 [Myxococcota bacterium]